MQTVNPLRTVEPTRASLLGPQDVFWWVTMMDNDHLMASAGGSLVRVAPIAPMGYVVDVHHETIGCKSKYGIHGVVAMQSSENAFVKIAGPAQVRFSNKPTSVGQLAIMNNQNGLCMAGNRSDVADMITVLGTIIEVAESGDLHTVAIGCFDFGSADCAPLAMFDDGNLQSSNLRTKIACGAFDLSTSKVDTTYPYTGISSIKRDTGAGCGLSGVALDGTVTVSFAPGFFASYPTLKTSVVNSAGVTTYDHIWESATHIMFKQRERAIQTPTAGTLVIYAMGPGY